MAGKVDWFLAEWLIVALILFSVLVEQLLHRLEHWVKHKHPPLQSVMRNVYRELMILGLVSFGFIMYIFIREPDSNVKMTFEVAHVFIFLFAVFHTLVVSFAVLVSLRLSARWKLLERMDLAEFVKSKQDYQALNAVRSRFRSFWWRHALWWIPNPTKIRRYSKLHEILAFHETRSQFIEWRALPPDFRFAKFLRRIKSAMFLQLVEIHWTHFVCFVLFIMSDIVRSKLNLHPSFGPAFVVLASVLNALFVSVLSIKIRKVFWKMTKNPSNYMEKSDPNESRSDYAVVTSQEEEETGAETANNSGHCRNSSGRNEGTSNGTSPGNEVKALDTHRSPFSYMLPKSDKTKTKVPQATQSAPEFELDNLVQEPKLPRAKAGASVESIQEMIAEENELKNLSTFRRVLKLDAMQRLQSSNDSDDEDGKKAVQQNTRYPRWVVKLAPRLGRVASPAERLFWFDSHRFFIWCVEWVLFFSNVNMASTIAKIAYLLKESVKKSHKYSSTTSVRIPLISVLRASQPAASASKVKSQAQSESLLLWCISLCVTVLVLGYVLLHIAGIMKKYILVMNSANLLPESITIDSIETVRLKNVLPSDTTKVDDTAQGYQSEEEEEDFSQMRRNMSRFIRSEGTTVEVGDA